MSGIDQKGTIDAELCRIMREHKFAISRTEAIHRLISERENRAELLGTTEAANGSWTSCSADDRRRSG